MPRRRYKPEEIVAKLRQLMSALGTERTFRLHRPMSAFKGRAEMTRTYRHVRLRPLPDLQLIRV